MSGHSLVQVNKGQLCPLTELGESKDKGIPNGYKERPKETTPSLVNTGLLERRAGMSELQVVGAGTEVKQISRDFHKGNSEHVSSGYRNSQDGTQQLCSAAWDRSTYNRQQRLVYFTSFLPTDTARDSYRAITSVMGRVK